METWASELLRGKHIGVNDNRVEDGMMHQPLRKHSVTAPVKQMLRTILPQDVAGGGLSLRGEAFMTVLTVLAVLRSTLPSFFLVLQNSAKRQP